MSIEYDVCILYNKSKITQVIRIWKCIEWRDITQVMCRVERVSSLSAVAQHLTKLFFSVPIEPSGPQ